MKMNKVKWYFDNDDVVFDGNHLQNSKGSGIFVNEKTHLLVVDFLASMYDYDFNTMFAEIWGIGCGGELPKPLKEYNNLYSYNDLTCDILNDVKMKTKTRVYAIDELWFDKNCQTLRNSNEDIHDISDDEFIDVAEEEGNAWSLAAFQNLLNCEGQGHLDFHKLKTHYFRFIDVEVSK